MLDPDDVSELELDADPELDVAALVVDGVVVPDVLEAAEFVDGVAVVELGVAVVELGVAVVELGVAVVDSGVAVVELGVAVVLVGVAVVLVGVAVVLVGVAVVVVGVGVFVVGVGVVVGVAVVVAGAVVDGDPVELPLVCIRRRSAGDTSWPTTGMNPASS